jgi:ATP-dependent exoDNAse (exonuclease V) beta subunit
MTPRTYRGYQEDPDAEHRVFYVACTRARESLYLHEPITPRHYEWPNT